MGERPKVELLVNGPPAEFELVFDSGRTGESKGKPWWSYVLKAIDGNAIPAGVDGTFFTSNERIAHTLDGYRRGDRVLLSKVKAVGDKYETVVVQSADESAPNTPRPNGNGNASANGNGAEPAPRKPKPRDVAPDKWPQIYAKCMLRAHQTRVATAELLAADETVGEAEAERVYEELGKIEVLKDIATTFFIQAMRL